jgi:hypothetical protein
VDFDKIKAAEEYISNPFKQIHFISGATWMEQQKERELEALRECCLNIRNRLRSKSVSMRAFKIIDEELHKVGLK